MNLLNKKGPRANPKLALSKTFHDNQKWNFSFKYWRQIEYFGLNESSPEWFVSLLEKLRNLCEMEVSAFLSDGVTKSRNRFHDIDWNSRNIPIKREDLDWLGSNYLDNAAEFPIVQFQISQALGRVIGFFDESNIFNIVLLDRMHNLQPSKNYNYKVDDTNILSCEYTSLRIKSERIINLFDCPKLKGKANSLLEEKLYLNVEVVALDDDELAKIKQLKAENKVQLTAELVSYGIMALEDEDTV